jgi:hypothetical protein
VKSAYCAAAGAAVLVIASLQATPSHAQTRVFVAPQGSDGNPCSFGAPCRTFQHAHDAVAAGGEITVLDSAGYGALTITKSITITNPGGVEAGISVSAGGTAININATSVIDVTLRGLTLQGGGVATNGVAVNSVVPGGTNSGSLNIIDCVVKDFTGSGLLIQPSTNAAGFSVFSVMVARSFFIQNATSGIKIPTTGLVAIQFLMSELIAVRNGTALDLAGAGNGGELVNSHFALNASGINLAANTQLALKNSSVRSNSIDVVNAGTLVLSDANAFGALSNNGQTFSDGTNTLKLLGNAISHVSPQ